MKPMRRALFLLPALALASCAPPGRQSFAASPEGADTQTIAAATAFQGRIPLVSIQPGTRDFAAPLQQAVKQALAIKPDAVFQVMSATPASGNPDADTKILAALMPQAEAVVAAIIADGIPPARITTGAKTAGQTPQILVYVK